jgi:hypothetical protein
MTSRSKRTIWTDYHIGDKLVKRTKSVHPYSACMNVVGHLQSDEYGATYAIIYDERRGTDIAIYHRSPSQITILYKRSA